MSDYSVHEQKVGAYITEEQARQVSDEAQMPSLTQIIILGTIILFILGGLVVIALSL